VTVTRLLDALVRAPRPLRQAAVGVDLLRSIGVREALQRKREDAHMAELAVGDIRPGYRRLWQDAADEVGAEMEHVGEGFLEFRRGDAHTRVWNNWVGLDDVVTARFAQDKTIGHRLLAAAGLPVPEHVAFRAGDAAPALAFLRATGGACVIKPVASAGGSGTTSGVCTPAQLRRAQLRAGRQNRDLLIERQAPGAVYRLLFLEGELIGAIRRLPPTVVGDGVATIAELIAAENARRFEMAAGERTWLLRADLDAVFTLQNAGRRLSCVPDADERVAVKTAVSQNGPQDNERVGADELAAELISEAKAAVALLGVRLAGVDLITAAPTRSLRDGGGVVLEVNATPGLHYHYDVRDRAHADRVMVPILRRLLDERPAPGPIRSSVAGPPAGH